MSNGRTALVTGASRGIGQAIVNLFRQKGIRVLAPSRSELNLLSNDSIDQYLSLVNEPIDILVNNAGINPLASCLDLLDSDLQDTFQINLIGPMRLVRGIVPSMRRRNYGRIVNISSIWSSVSKPGRVVYSASKSGLNGLTRTLAVELAKYNILVNAVAPGFVNTELTRQNNSDSEIRSIAETIPVGRLADPAEIAEVVGFLCSDKNSYITGQILFVDGGYTCL
ncbi:SDR family NAD(P)-dependent oxidoreductase [Effusibacillus consociatus]|uniref:SDR family NAD(P)-dependent oxidoreductase n=1 Tax=Effusibacillus consociatus TaxID=1117041 RepID=A0ABV9PYX8_9BACL